MDKDSTKNVLTVAISLCVVCSLLVSGLAVMWRDQQELNQILDIKRNVLLAAGLEEESKGSPADVEEAFKQFKPVVIDFSTGEAVSEENYLPKFDPAKYDLQKITKDPIHSAAIPRELDGALVLRRPIQAVVYERYVDGKLNSVVLPMQGMGLWGLMYGFLALENDLSTVKGIKYYAHKETPGLGAEVDAGWWRDAFQGKQIYTASGAFALDVVKGVGGDDPHKMDGISGATITCNGVDGSLAYWMGDDGYGPYLANLRARIEEGAN